MSAIAIGVRDEDLSSAYRSLAERLECAVRRDVRAPEAVIEDACQVAWSRLLTHTGRVRREAMLAWLTTTAVREALKLIRRDARELSLAAELEPTGEVNLPALGPEPDELVELREQLNAIAYLPDRQRRLVWLQGSGHTYAEMAGAMGLTVRTVERQLERARRDLKAAESG